MESKNTCFSLRISVVLEYRSDHNSHGLKKYGSISALSIAMTIDMLHLLDKLLAVSSFRYF